MSPKRTPKTDGSKPDLQADEEDEAAVEPEEDEELEIEDDSDVDLEDETADVPASRPPARPSPPRPWGGNRGAVSPDDLAPDELTPEMRWPPGSWVKVTDVVRHSTGEVIEGLEVGDVGQVIAALSQTLVVLFPTRDNRREVLHIDSIEAVEVKAGRSRP